MGFGKMLMWPFGQDEEDPSAAAKQYLDQIPGIGKQYYNPFIERGAKADEQLGGQYNELLTNPVGFLNNIMKQYQPSEQYGANRDMLSRELSNTAAAGGISGTPFHQQQQGDMIRKLLSQDQQQFYQNALGNYTSGMQGRQGESNKGFLASNWLTDLLGGALNQQAGLAFRGAEDKNASNDAFTKLLMQGLGAAGGFAFGGPMGAYAMGTAMGGK